MTSKTDRAREIAEQYIDTLDYGALKAKIKEEVPCSRTLAHNAITWVKRQRKGEVPQEPKVTIEDEEKKEPQFMEEPQAIEEIGKEEMPPVAEHLISEGEMSAEDLEYVFGALNQVFPEKHQRPDKAMRILGKLWYRPFNKMWSKLTEQNPMLAVAIVVTVITFLPSFIGVISDWRKSKKKEKKEETPSKKT